MQGVPSTAECGESRSVATSNPTFGPSGLQRERSRFSRCPSFAGLCKQRSSPGLHVRSQADARKRAEWMLNRSKQMPAGAQAPHNVRNTRLKEKVKCSTQTAPVARNARAQNLRAQTLHAREITRACNVHALKTLRARVENVTRARGNWRQIGGNMGVIYRVNLNLSVNFVTASPHGERHNQNQQSTICRLLSDTPKKVHMLLAFRSRNVAATRRNAQTICN